MIRGALILTIGFALGYGKALYDNEEIKIVANEAREYLNVLIEQTTEPVVDADFVDSNVVPDTIEGVFVNES